MDRRKFNRKLSEINTRAVSRRQNELEGKFKMAAGDKVMLVRINLPLFSTVVPSSIFMWKIKVN